MIQDDLKTVVLLLNKMKIDYALVGGLAVSTWLEPRATKDIDIIVLDVDDETLELGLETAGFVFKSTPMQINKIKFKRISKLNTDDDLLMLDLMECVNAEYNQAILNGASIVNFDGIDIKVALPEDLLILKSFSDRNIDKMDIENINHMKDLNKEYIDLWLKKLS